MEIFRSMSHGFLLLSPVSLTELCSFWYSAQVSRQSCPWPLKLMTSQRVERTWIRTGGSGANGLKEALVTWPLGASDLFWEQSWMERNFRNLGRYAYTTRGCPLSGNFWKCYYIRYWKLPKIQTGSLDWMEGALKAPAPQDSKRTLSV